MSELLDHSVVVQASALARMSCCVACGGQDVGDFPGEFDPQDWVAVLVCLSCGHRWSVNC
ncbi:hypothetical protein [Modestobacter sp. VKM Ac-2984]|uniref:hypothetical protein n=1 Tax=Modestobacter sp. VKM Ac-2984 TaxID=3004138 RepID=UPI0022AB16C4|nr:hypothetical protein [Modestobacter sp. VKM Ac-2984]MCZ2818139.1 hypothetical protein [Modestobacter sp. VKM Ac-2984]